MSWMQKLYETYERCAGNEQDGMERLMPICHTTQQAQIEIVLNDAGLFRRAFVIDDKNDRETLIPCTEESSGRAGSKPVNHPLCDKLQYVAGDFLDYGGEVTSGFASNGREPHAAFLASLRRWGQSGNGHPKLKAILRYVEAGLVMSDLVKEQILPLDASGKLLSQWPGEKDAAPAIFKAIQNTQAPADAFIRWRVEEVGSPGGGTWQDPELIQSWVAYYQANQTKLGCCMASGSEAALAIQHPAKLRHGGDKAKLISSNDTSGFTFRGRLIDPEQVASVSFDVTQKAHNALRWLIKHQAFRNGDQVVVSWAVSGKPLPDPFLDIRFLDPSAGETPPESASAGTAQALALRLARAIAGYGSKIDAGDDIVVMALDSATPGRMSITFYRELKGSEFLKRIEEWHTRYAWLQNFGKDARFIGAAAPRDIAEAAYGRRLDEKLRKATIERLLPCIVDRSPLPRDLVSSTVQRAVNRIGLDKWEWEKCLGIACGLYKGFEIERKNYQMALEQNRTSRDYLYGRLLAIADSVESYALNMTGEKRDTTAARLMQRFADHPASTWPVIYRALNPYMARLRSGEKTAAFLFARTRLLDEVVASFEPEEFVSNAKLSGEFLLGYHCQRQIWRYGAGSGDQEAPTEATIEN